MDTTGTIEETAIQIGDNKTEQIGKEEQKARFITTKGKRIQPC